MHQASFTPGTGNEITTRVGHDPRADGGRRMVVLGPRCVMIKRRLRGMKMHLSVPVESYAGVAIACEERPEGAFYRVSLAHRDPELCVTLKEARDQSVILDAWRRWAAFFSAPRLVERAGGAWETIDPPFSGALGGQPALARRSAPSSIRRLRRSSRRKAVWLNRPPKVFRGETEIIGGE